ncbi:MAG: GNAT family N-acetyltransferase [Tagaea sp.]
MSGLALSPIGLDDIDDLLPLLLGYRVFYKREPLPEESRAYMRARFAAGDYAGFLARLDGKPAGFAILSPTFSSGVMKRIWLLNDIFVEPSLRKAGVGAALMKRVEEFGRETGAGRIDLFTAQDNKTAQSVYERAGYARDTVFFRYQKNL